MIDITGSLVLELRADALLTAWTGGHERVRGGKAAPGDARGPGEYLRFLVVMTQGSLPREKRAPVQYPRHLVRVYGVDDADAMAGYGYASDALHRLQPRLRLNGIGIYLSSDDSGADPGSDPDTDQPYAEFVVQSIAPTQVVAA